MSLLQMQVAFRSLVGSGGRLALLGACLFFAAQASLAATIEVDADCPLENAITAANNDSNSHDTDCTAGSGADTIDLANFVNNLNALASGATITSDITIEGRGKTVGAAGTARVFTINSNGTLTLKDITLSSGVANPGTPGSLVRNLGKTTIINSVFRTAGNAMVFSTGQLVISGSTIRDGNSGVNGGGIRIAGGSLTMSNSTVADNTSSAGAGGIYIGGGATATFSHVTVWNNTGASNDNAGEIEVSGAGTVLSLRNSIVCDNDANTADLLLTLGGALRQNVGNVIGEGSAKTTATCGDLGSRTGSPGYYIPPSGSGALGIGNAAICKAFPLDQRGFYRPETACDAGAVERDGYNYINADGTTCTIVEAMISADEDSNSNAAGCIAGVADATATDVIWLKADAALTAALRAVDTDIILDGGGKTISRKGTSTGAFRPFTVESGGDLTLRNITLSGHTQTSGAAVLSKAKLTLQNCRLESNTDTSSSGGGGALRITSGASETIVDRCAFISNDSQNDSGGAIMHDDGNLTVSNSTFLSNTCAGSGCGIFINADGDDVNVSHATFWNNESDSNNNTSTIHASAPNQSGKTRHLRNSILGHSAPNSQAICTGDFTGRGVDGASLLVWNGPQAHGCGSDDTIVANPNLGAQRGFPPYLPIPASSPARRIGIDSACADYPLDVTGTRRPATNCDAGAFQFPLPPSSAPDSSSADLGPPKTGGRWVQYADGSWHYVRPGEDNADKTRPVCTGEELNESSRFKVSTTYGLCTGVQFNQLELSAIGIGYVVEAGPLAAIDVWGWVTSHVEVCYGGQVSALFLDAAASPRTVSRLDSIWDGAWTCAQISRAGTIVFMPAQSSLTTAPVNAPDSPPPATPLANCMAQLNYILNFRETPGGAVMRILPYAVRLTAFQRTADWVEVDWYGARGWVSAHHVTLEGDC